MVSVYGVPWHTPTWLTDAPFLAPPIVRRAQTRNGLGHRQHQDRVAARRREGLAQAVTPQSVGIALSLQRVASQRRWLKATWTC